MGSRNSRRTRSKSESGDPSRPLRPRPIKGDARAGRSRHWALLGGGLLVAVIAVVAGAAMLSAQPPRTGSGAVADRGTVVEANGGQWTNITPEILAAKMEIKGVTLLNVKTPYIGEIAGTDLYIPYTDLAARAAELPSDRAAPIVVYCRTGNESAIAAQALLDLGYTNISNLDGGMTAWLASGRSLVQVPRS